MRAVQDANYLYIFNPWSNGQRVFRNESQSGRTFKAMQAAAEGDEAIAARVRLFMHRDVEELYDMKRDVDCLYNLADDATYTDALNEMCAALRNWMVETGDSALEAFDRRDDAAALEAYIQQQEAHCIQLRKRVGI
jgi:N-sulfoglucosamine sulfohydrolase